MTGLYVVDELPVPGVRGRLLWLDGIQCRDGLTVGVMFMLFLSECITAWCVVQCLHKFQY